MTTTEPPTTPGLPRLEPEELPRMSLGDHIDELRGRLIKSAVAVAVAMLVVLPFKDTVTWIYVRPYEQVWFSSYVGFLADLDAKEVAAKAAGTPLDELLGDKIDFHRKHRRASSTAASPRPATTC